MPFSETRVSSMVYNGFGECSMSARSSRDEGGDGREDSARPDSAPPVSPDAITCRNNADLDKLLGDIEAGASRNPPPSASLRNWPQAGGSSGCGDEG